MENRDYFVLCVLNFTPKYNNGGPWSVREMSHFCDLDISLLNKTIQLLLEEGFIHKINTKPIKYSYDGGKINEYFNKKRRN